MLVVLFFAIFFFCLALAAAGLVRSFVSAASAHRKTMWLLITVSMLVTPIVIIAGLALLIQQDVIGPGPVIALIPLGAVAFMLGSLAEARFGEVASLALRVAGWSLLVAPMIVSLVLSVLLPIPLFLAFYVHPRWKRGKDLNLATESSA